MRSLREMRVRLHISKLTSDFLKAEFESNVQFSFHSGLPIIPTDLFPRELSDITGVRYSRIKIGFDITCLAVTAGLTFFCLGRIKGLGIGTILAAFTMGKGIALIGGLIDKKFVFENFLTLRKKAQA